MIQLTLVAALACCMTPEVVEPDLKELLPGLRIAEGIVEFRGEIAVDAHHPDTPDVYLEMFVTAPDSREHESIVVSRIKGSNLHAALLAAGFEPGAPLSRDADGELVNAHGDELSITIATVADDTAFVPITDWVFHVDDETGITEAEKWGGFVFAGSRLTRRGYEADGTGTLVSLTSFGNEVIAPAWSLSHLAEIDEPVWIANRELIPEKGTPVIVRIEREGGSHEPDRVDVDRDP
ncbi:MAG: YdjY domain-containing protein [Phycisphaerales bacterium]